MVATENAAKNEGSPMTSAAALEAAFEANEGVETDRCAVQGDVENQQLQ